MHMLFFALGTLPPPFVALFFASQFYWFCNWIAIYGNSAPCERWTRLIPNTKVMMSWELGFTWDCGFLQIWKVQFCGVSCFSTFPLHVWLNYENCENFNKKVGLWQCDQLMACSPSFFFPPWLVFLLLKEIVEMLGFSWCAKAKIICIALKERGCLLYKKDKWDFRRRMD